MDKPTAEQVQAEIAALKEIKPKVRHYSFFGDDNHAAIDAQVRVLEEDLPENAIFDRWENDEHILSAARDAFDWLRGDYELEEGQASFADAWQDLVKE